MVLRFKEELEIGKKSSYKNFATKIPPPYHQWKGKGLTWYPFVLDVSLVSPSLYKIRQAKLCLDRKEAFPEYVPKTLIISILPMISFIKRNTLSLIFLLWIDMFFIALHCIKFWDEKSLNLAPRHPNSTNSFGLKLKVLLETQFVPRFKPSLSLSSHINLCLFAKGQKMLKVWFFERRSRAFDKVSFSL